MCKQISTEYVLGSVLYYRPEGISLSELNAFERKVYRCNADLIIDISKSAIISVMESRDEYFKLLIENKVSGIRQIAFNGDKLIFTRFLFRKHDKNKESICRCR